MPPFNADIRGALHKRSVTLFKPTLTPLWPMAAFAKQAFSRRQFLLFQKWFFFGRLHARIGWPIGALFPLIFKSQRESLRMAVSTYKSQGIHRMLEIRDCRDAFLPSGSGEITLSP